MNKIQKKILLVAIITLAVTAGYTVFMVKNVAYWRSQPEYIMYQGNGNEVLSGANLNNSLSSKKRTTSKSGTEKDLAAEVNIAGSNLMPGSNGINASGSNYMFPGRNNNLSSNKRGSTSEIAVSSGGGASGLLALGGSKGHSTQSGVGGISSAPLTETNMDLGVPSVRQFGKGGNGKGGGGGGPGGDPDVPVGDGLWILLLMAAGYMFYIRRK